MSTDIDRIKKIFSENSLVDAVELPPNHQKKSHLIDDVEEALSKFDDDMDYAHFVVRVKRSANPLPKEAGPIEESELLNIDEMVNETLELSKSISEQRRKEVSSEKYEPTFLIENARILFENGENELARNVYKSLIKQGIFINESLFGIAKCYDSENNFLEAIRFYEEAIAYAPCFEAYQGLAAVQIRSGDDKQAASTLSRGINMPGLTDEQKFDFHKSLGNCYSRTDEHDKAEENYWSAYELNSDSDSLQVNVGSLALQKGSKEIAKKHFERALELNSKNDKAIMGLGMISSMDNQLEKAHGYFLESLSINPDNLTAIFNLVKCAYDIKKFSEASRILKSYISTHPINTNILYSYAGILYHQGEYPAALAEAKKILDSNPNHGGARELQDLIQKKM